jgi:hypothetical protein
MRWAGTAPLPQRLQAGIQEGSRARLTRGHGRYHTHRPSNFQGLLDCAHSFFNNPYLLSLMTPLQRPLPVDLPP